MCFKIKDRMDNVQNCDSYINIPSSQTYRYYLRWIMSRIVIAILIYPRHKPIDLIYDG
jgi:hypothetical protein